MSSFLRKGFASGIDNMVTPISAEVHAEEIARLRKWTDKDWSLVDATSFNIMRERKITEALAKDGDFVEAGFKELLSPTT